MKILFAFFTGAVLLCFCGCSSYDGDFVQKSEKELAQMEADSQRAHEAFTAENYEDAEKILRGLTEERTVSRPLYQLELLSVLLMSGKNDEAHNLMMSIHQDLEVLFDVKLEEKALSVWHGEVNKVFKGDSYERSTFYAFMALSFIRKGNYEDALRCVKNGLLADADSNAENAVEDYAMLYMIGYLAALKMDSPEDAAEYMDWMIKALACRRELSETEQRLLKDKFSADFQRKKPNVLLAVWAGTPPTIACVGEYKETRAVIRGNAAFDMLGVYVENAAPFYPAGSLGDIDYQATSRGGRMMDNVLADKAAAKKAMEVSGNIFFIAGSACLAVAGYMQDPATQLSLLGAGLGCYVFGAGVHVVGYFMNPAADGRFWKNLPGQIILVPLCLEPGEYNLMCAGYKASDRTGILLDKIKVAPDTGGMQIFHLPMMSHGLDWNQAKQRKFKTEQQNILPRANADRMLKELK